TLQALFSEFRREWIVLRRYPTETLSELVSLVVIFYGLFLGATYMAGGTLLGSHLSDIIISYALWTLSLSALGNMGYGIANEAQNGTLEQVFLSPLGGGAIFFLRNIAQLVVNVLMTVIVLLIITVITGHHLDLNPQDLIPLALAAASAIGLGYLVASITILFKRTNQLLSIGQFALLFLIMVPFSDMHGWLRDVGIVSPLSPMVTVLKLMMVHGQPMIGPGGWFWWSLVNVAIWLGIGWLMFRAASRRAMTLGSLSHY
ncbi:MAG: ABC transporter permease, partial [Firmicutes bacterium]|nr:ABC transporter permease [Bacillota bacterium]